MDDHDGRRAHRRMIGKIVRTRWFTSLGEDNMLKNMKFLLGVAVVAIMIGANGAAMAADKISIMVCGFQHDIYVAPKLAEQLGYFKEEGLDVELLSEPAGVEAENELL